METRTYNVYKFNELTPEQQEKAINRFRELQDLWFTWEQTKHDARQIGLILEGLDRGSMRGHFVESAKVCADLIIANHGDQCETYKSAQGFLNNIKGVDDEDSLEEYAQEFLRSILEDYRIMQEKEEEFQNSDEAIKETIKANDYWFTEKGEID